MVECSAALISHWLIKRNAERTSGLRSTLTASVLDCVAAIRDGRVMAARAGLTILPGASLLRRGNLDSGVLDRSLVPTIVDVLGRAADGFVMLVDGGMFSPHTRAASRGVESLCLLGDMFEPRDSSGGIDGRDEYRNRWECM